KPPADQSRKMEQPAKELSVDSAGGRNRSQRRATGSLRCAQPAGPEAAGGQRRAVAPVLAGGHGSLPEGFERSERRNVRDQRRLQEGADFTERLPRRRLSLVAGRRV